METENGFLQYLEIRVKFLEQFAIKNSVMFAGLYLYDVLCPDRTKTITDLIKNGCIVDWMVCIGIAVLSIWILVDEIKAIRNIKTISQAPD